MSENYFVCYEDTNENDTWKKVTLEELKAFAMDFKIDQEDAFVYKEEEAIKFNEISDKVDTEAKHEVADGCYLVCSTDEMGDNVQAIVNPDEVADYCEDIQNKDSILIFHIDNANDLSTDKFRDEIIPAEISSVWDGGLTITAKCNINTNTREVFDIQTVDVDGVDCLDEEYVTINGVNYPVTSEDEAGFLDFYY